MLGGHGDFWDAKNYLRTIVDLKKGTSPYTLSYMQTLGPPLVIVPYVPLSVFPEQMGLAIFTIASIGAGYASCWLLVKKCWTGDFKIEKVLLLGLLLFSAFPTRFNFITGQWGLLSVLLLTVFITTQSPKTRGMLLGLLIVLKTFFGFSLLSVAAKNKSRKIIWWALIMVASIFLICLPLLKFSYYREYRERFAGVMWQPDRIVDVAYYNQSLKTTFSRWGLVNYSVPLWVGVSLVAALYCLWSGNILVAIVFSLVLSPVAWQHYYVILFPLLVVTFSKVRRSKKWLAIWLVSVFLWWVELPWLHQQSVGWWTGLLASHYLISALLLSSILVYNYHHET